MNKDVNIYSAYKLKLYIDIDKSKNIYYYYATFIFRHGKVQK